MSDLDLTPEQRRALHRKQKLHLIQKAQKGLLSEKERRMLGLDDMDDGDDPEFDEDISPQPSKRFTLRQLSQVYGISEKSLSRYRNDKKIDILSVKAVFAHVAGLTRIPEGLVDQETAQARMIELTGSADPTGEDGLRDATLQELQYKLIEAKVEKFQADAIKAQYGVQMLRNELVSLDDDVIPTQTKVFTDFVSEARTIFRQLGELCDRAPGHEIMSKGEELWDELAQRYADELRHLHKDLARGHRTNA